MRPAPEPEAIPNIPTKPRIPRYLSCPTVGRLLDISPAWVRTWHREGLLKGFVLHAVPGDRGRLLFLESDVRDFLAARGLPVDGDR